MATSVKPIVVMNSCVWRFLWERSMDRRPVRSDESGIPGHSFTFHRSASILCLLQICRGLRMKCRISYYHTDRDAQMQINYP